MLIDARHIDCDTVIDVPLCVIGAGPAGLGLALSFDGRPTNVLVLESGSLAFDEKTQSLAEAEMTGVPMLAPHVSRYRGFGGTTKRWAGYFRPLDRDDFAERSWLPLSGWPFGAEELAPYYREALSFVGLDAVDWDPKEWQSTPRAIAKLPADTGPLAPANLYRGPRRHFGHAYAGQMKRSKNVQTFLNANVTELIVDEAARRVETVAVACLNGNRFFVRPRVVVLATGGIENARLLLLSNKVRPQGLGNDHDVVGRYLMNHPHLAAAWLTLGPNGHAQRGTLHRLVRMAQRITLTADVQASAQIAKFSAYLYPVAKPALHPFSASEGLTSLGRLLGVGGRSPAEDGLGTTLRKIVTDFPNLMGDLHRKLTDNIVPRTTLSVVLETEQIPNRESRIYLSSARDALGLNRAVVNWQLDPLDKRTMKTGLAIMADVLERCGVGVMTYDDWMGGDDVDLFPGEDWAHHAGTTRMSDDPRTGVVDRDGRVHGLANLYATGCSVFPTEGIAPPTLTILALAHRLARHLKTAWV